MFENIYLLLMFPVVFFALLLFVCVLGFLWEWTRFILWAMFYKKDRGEYSD